jgi:hypothetical protein
MWDPTSQIGGQDKTTQLKIQIKQPRKFIKENQAILNWGFVEICPKEVLLKISIAVFWQILRYEELKTFISWQNHKHKQLIKYKKKNPPYIIATKEDWTVAHVRRRLSLL